MRFSGKSLRNIVMLGGIAMFFAGAFWHWAFPHLFVFDEKQLNAQIPATIFTDSRGNAVHTETGSDYALRFPVSLEDLPKHLIDVTLAAEDRRFFEHDGVDLCAVARAGAQLLTSGRIISGASTVTMQLVALGDERRERSFLRKIVQMGKARNLELSRSKEEILEEYFNRLPYGGKIYGIEAAANYYFGRSARELNLGESVLLAGIPQRPNRFRPDRFPEAALARRECVLQMLINQGIFTKEKADAIRHEPLRFRDFEQPAFPRAEDPQFFLWARSKHPEIRGKFTTTLDMTTQKIVKSVVAAQLRELFSVRDGAVIVIENKLHAIRAFLGTTDFYNPRDGQVNAATSRRSPGSLLKPFIFGEAVNGGLIVSETLMDDSPISVGEYRPENFSGKFLGKVPAEIALSKSLNVPAVRLLEELGVERNIEMLKLFGIHFSEGKTAESIGLSLALGGAETTLLQLAEAYSALANDSVPAKLQCLKKENPPESEKAIWNPGSAEMVLQMLRLSPLPEAENLEVAWKTGTSNGLRDAWCIAVTREWTVAVWFGNKDGSPAPELVGAEVAAPVAGRIINALYRGKIPDNSGRGLHFRSALLCAESGLAASSFCSKTFPAKAVVGIPLKTCRRCKSLAPKSLFLQETRIVQPVSGTYRRGFNGKARFILKSIPQKSHWYLNGNYIGFLNSGTPLEIPPGKHRLFAWGGEKYSAAKLEIEVK